MAWLEFDGVHVVDSVGNVVYICAGCNRPIQVGERLVSLVDRLTHRSYLIHARSCEDLLIHRLESEDSFYV